MAEEKDKNSLEPESAEPTDEVDESTGEGYAPEPTQESDAATAAEPSVESLSERIEKLEIEKNEQFDRLLRLKAEFENYKKRVRRDVQQHTRYAEEEFLRRLLPVLDSFDRALAEPAPRGDISAVWEGLDKIREQFHNVLVASGVEPLDSVGTKFDPYYHEAMLTVESDEHPENTVVNELERGYTLRGKVIRPAKVAVSVAKKNETPPEVEDSDTGGADADTEPQDTAGENE